MLAVLDEGPSSLAAEVRYPDSAKSPMNAYPSVSSCAKVIWFCRIPGVNRTALELERIVSERYRTGPTKSRGRRMTMLPCVEATRKRNLVDGGVRDAMVMVIFRWRVSAMTNARGGRGWPGCGVAARCTTALMLWCSEERKRFGFDPSGGPRVWLTPRVIGGKVVSMYHTPLMGCWGVITCTKFARGTRGVLVPAWLGSYCWDNCCSLKVLPNEDPGR